MRQGEASSGDPRARPPNVLLVVVDCLRADRALAPERPLPLLERLAREGTVFTETISAATLTPPSFGSILTGSPPFAHGLRTLRSTLAPGVPTIQEAFRAAGYHTVARVTGPLSEETGLFRGYDDARWRPVEEYLDTAWGASLRAEIPRVPSPWFLLLHLWELHWPRRIPLAKHRARYGATRYDRALSALDDQLALLFDRLPPSTIVALTGDHGEHLGSSYDRVGAARLAATEILRWSWRRLWSIAGPLGAERRRSMRGRLGFADVLHGADVTDELLRVPLILAGPGVPRALCVRGQVRHIDIAPTLLGLAGIAAPTDLPGSLLRDVSDGRVPDRTAYAEAAGPPLVRPEQWLACVRADGYKLVHRPYDRDAMARLFDLGRDPDERDDLASVEPARAARMEETLRTMLGGAIGPTAPIDDQRVLERLGDLGYLEDR